MSEEYSEEDFALKLDLSPIKIAFKKFDLPVLYFSESRLT